MRTIILGCLLFTGLNLYAQTQMPYERPIQQQCPTGCGCQAPCHCGCMEGKPCCCPR